MFDRISNSRNIASAEHISLITKYNVIDKGRGEKQNGFDKEALTLIRGWFVASCRSFISGEKVREFKGICEKVCWKML